MSAFIESSFTIHSDADTIYRVKPNPDADFGSDCGIVLEWSDDGKEWRGHFFVPPEVVNLLAEAIIKCRDDNLS